MGSSKMAGAPGKHFYMFEADLSAGPGVCDVKFVHKRSWEEEGKGRKLTFSTSDAINFLI